MIRAVLFDFYDTLGTLQAEPILATRRELARRGGADQERFFDVWRQTLQARSLGHLGPLEQELAAVFAELGLSPAPALLAELADLERATWCAAVRFYPGARETLATLRGRGLRLGLVSNCSAQAAAAIRHLGAAELLDTLVLSCEAGLVKPDPAIFLRACAELAVRPDEAAFVGDGGSRELEAAFGLGLLTLRLEHPEHRADLAVGQPYHRHLTALDQVPAAVAARGPCPPSAR